MCSNIFESQRVGKRLYGSTAQPALRPAQILKEVDTKALYQQLLQLVIIQEHLIVEEK